MPGRLPYRRLPGGGKEGLHGGLQQRRPGDRPSDLRTLVLRLCRARGNRQACRRHRGGREPPQWRSFHLPFQIYWSFVAWVGTTIFWLPRFYKKEPESQSALIELLSAGCAIVAVGPRQRCLSSPQEESHRQQTHHLLEPRSRAAQVLRQQLQAQQKHSARHKEVSREWTPCLHHRCHLHHRPTTLLRCLQAVWWLHQR